MLKVASQTSKCTTFQDSFKLRPATASRQCNVCDTHHTIWTAQSKQPVSACNSTYGTQTGWAMTKVAVHQQENRHKKAIALSAYSKLALGTGPAISKFSECANAVFLWVLWEHEVPGATLFVRSYSDLCLESMLRKMTTQCILKGLSQQQCCPHLLWFYGHLPFVSLITWAPEQVSLTIWGLRLTPTVYVRLIVISVCRQSCDIQMTISFCHLGIMPGSDLASLLQHPPYQRSICHICRSDSKVDGTMYLPVSCSAVR